jgi:hypothetical protein
MSKDWTQEEAARIDAEDAGNNVVNLRKDTITAAQYWEAQASMWHQNYVEAHRYELDHEMFMDALERIATGKATAERAKQIALRVLQNRKVRG